MLKEIEKEEQGKKNNEIKEIEEKKKRWEIKLKEASLRRIKYKKSLKEH